MVHHLDPYGFMIPEIFPSGEADSPLNLVDSCDCEFWFDGLDAITFTLNGNKVIQWDDKSGFGRNVLNGVDATRPTYDPVTGRVTFVTANSTFLQSAAFGAALTQPNTIFIVYKITGALADAEIVFTGLAANGRNQFGYSGSFFNMRAGISINNGATDANDNIHTVEFNGANSNYWLNGVLSISGNAGADPLDGSTIGANRTVASNFADCQIMEVFGYNCLITAEERNALTAYLNAKWGVY